QKLQEEQDRVKAIKDDLSSKTASLNKLAKETKDASDIPSLESKLAALGALITTSKELETTLSSDKSKDSFEVEFDTFKDALKAAIKEQTESKTRLQALKDAKDALDRIVKEALQQADNALEEAENNKNSEDKAKLTE
ncbi:hypothetical protein OF364_03025, partial [Mycoplasma enhydrae]|uniref:hypothetical protein n=1 Tax=Mycoplasma enhydrae TaxID=2499220 RepID=UPI0021E7B54F